MEPNHIYQYSLIDALMSGVCNSGIPVSKFKTTGTQGLGTFVRMNGEMLFLDGTVYQLLSSGTVREAEEDEQLPFAVSTNFVPQKTLPHVSMAAKEDVARILDEFDDHAANLFMTYRITGHFKRVKCRTVKGQSYPEEPLSELGKKQFVAEYEDVQGTVVGFRSPERWQGFTVAGQHLHFINRDRKRGGHVLELEAADVQMEIAVVSNIHVELPTSEDFGRAKLTLDQEGIKGAEG